MALLLEIEMASPPAGATPFRVTVQVELPAASEVGEQLRPLSGTLGPAVTVTVVVWLCALLVAVTVIVWLVETVPAVAVNDAVLVPAPIITLAGTVNAPLLLARVIVVAFNAVLFKLTVQVADAPAARLFGVQLTALNCAGPLRFRVKFCVTLFKLAVSNAA